MFQQLTTLYENQAKTKIQWTYLKNSYFKIIYQDVLEHKTAKQIHTDLTDLTISKKIYSKPLLAYAMIVANKAVKQDKGVGHYYGTGGLDVLAVGLINLFTREAVNYKANVIINQELRKQEDKGKQEIIKSEVEDNRNTGKLFYLSSKHANSAKDHKDYQARFYVDEAYRQHDPNGEIELFVIKNQIPTLQWVLGPPVYFTTRPHCKHYFRAYTLQDIQNKNYHVPVSRIKDRLGYKTEDVRGMEVEERMRYYQDRLKMLRALQSVRDTSVLKNKILKTELLLRKWKQYNKMGF